MNKKDLIKVLKNAGFGKNITNAFSKVSRENFMLGEYKKYSYEDEAFPIDYGQTISQPFTIAFMLDLLSFKYKNRVLEIGSGSGYVLALISEIIKHNEVIGIERVKELADSSGRILSKNKNIKIIHGNALELLKHKELGKFDRILVSASYNQIPKYFIEMLNDDGVLVMPVHQSIFQIKKIKNKLIKKEFSGFLFVPLVDGKG
ncbi:L-isoaspartyl protein carboxyl methyltransferase [Candidatus Pacearchaeota archaeon]|nr:L-isoaspartyl protein carboxyl methyltransferase [Candidatus Pacearchaeota archaeon]